MSICHNFGPQCRDVPKLKVGRPSRDWRSAISPVQSLADRVSFRRPLAPLAVSFAAIAFAGCLVFGSQEATARTYGHGSGGLAPNERDAIAIAGKNFWLGMGLEEILKSLPAGLTAKEGPPNLWVIRERSKDTGRELGSFLIRDGRAVSIVSFRADLDSGDERFLPELYAALAELSQEDSQIELNLSERVDLIDGQKVKFRIISFQRGKKSLTIVTQESRDKHKVSLTESLYQ